MSVGSIAYDSFRSSNKAAELPLWKDVSPETRAAWDSASQAAVNAVVFNPGSTPGLINAAKMNLQQDTFTHRYGSLVFTALEEAELWYMKFEQARAQEAAARKQAEEARAAAAGQPEQQAKEESVAQEPSAGLAEAVKEADAAAQVPPEAPCGGEIPA